ncbi:MAG TPA: hypothetical protein VM488_18935 [Pseudobacter sp.]|nr:hypothetical protein [Pseudobacter sp.]
MTKLLYVCLALTLMAFQCKKNDAGSGTELTGKWKMVEYWVSPGTIDLTRHPAPSDNLYVTFSANSGFSSNIDKWGYDQFRSYHLIDHQQMNLIKSGMTDKVKAFYTLGKDTLTISVFGCVEGCGEVFVRVK